MVSFSLRPLSFAWLALVALTLVSLGLGEGFHGRTWLPLLVAAIVWVKGLMVARHFIGSGRVTPFIAWLLRIFVAFAPLLLILTALCGPSLARIFRL